MYVLIFALIISPGAQHSNAAKAEASFIQVSQGQLSVADWEGWQQDEKRMAWWLDHGWTLTKGAKAGLNALSGDKFSTLDRVDFNPMLLNLAPDAQKHQAWTIKGEVTLTLYSLARCEQLYQRYLVNQGSGYFND
jgi:hypothetical protein